MDRVREIVSDELFAWIRQIRRTIHEEPEVGFKEYKTGELIGRYLDGLGIGYISGVARTGIVGRLVTDERRPTVALRADMDALSLTEETGLPFASKVKGVMHACGHDGHVAMLLGAARILKENPPPGNVVFIFQPNEEGSGGARPMIDEGVTKGIDAIYAAHLDSHYATGEIAIKPGVNSAYTDTFEVQIVGSGGHGARPHEAVDALMIACQIAIQFQLIVSRELDPLQPAVLTIGQLHAGTVSNAIAERALLRGTIRTTSDHIRKRIIERMNVIATAFSTLNNAYLEVRHFEGYPPVVNHQREYEIVREVAENLIGSEKIIDIPLPSMGGEDFSYFLREVPGCFYRIGASIGSPPGTPLHSPHFDFDEDALRIGAAFMAELAATTLRTIQ
ncbi:MAG: amidohydrolase [Magnetococcales bacterium]|uniref:Amidohydrolase n=1 Tax=Candidatus Magnetobacterium casense TaxID=1455061 RepID=A0ABS6RYA1_9BACT|nr:M20 family metallopeptidase [Candidatus Magnetobacterium casensis]MBF0606815.1 amidohydrolase [Nitrospirota bacterium]MBV6341305.1 amidohydrolase [Candidatus Magnetobacterium casensis]